MTTWKDPNEITNIKVFKPWTEVELVKHTLPFSQPPLALISRLTLTGVDLLVMIKIYTFEYKLTCGRYSIVSSLSRVQLFCDPSGL